MWPRFNEQKTTELASLFLEKSGGRMPYLKLMKLLYLADREAMVRHGSPITGDCYVSMKNGPVLSSTYDIIKGASDATSGGPGEYWTLHILRDGYDVVLVSAVEPILSEADREIAFDISTRFGTIDQWKLADLTHLLPEWRDPGKSAIPIDYEDILAACNWSKEEAEELLSRLRTRALLEEYSRR